MLPLLLLDTHILVWWLLDDMARLGKAYVELLAEAQRQNHRVAVSAISLWEIAKLVEKGKLDLDGPLAAFLNRVEDHRLLTALPLTADIIVESVGRGSVWASRPLLLNSLQGKLTHY